MSPCSCGSDFLHGPCPTTEPYPGADCRGCGDWFEYGDLDDDDYCAACAKSKPKEDE